MSSDQKCQCEAAGYCERRKCFISQVHWEKCQAGKIAMLDSLYEQSSAPKRQPRKEADKPPVVSSIGTKLAEIIRRETSREIDCGSCKQEVLRLNTLSSEEVLAEREAIADSILERGRSLLGWWSPKRWAAALAPAAVKEKIVSWIDEAIELGSAPLHELPIAKLPIAQVDTTHSLPRPSKIAARREPASRSLPEADLVLASGRSEAVSRAELLKMRSDWRARGFELPRLVRGELPPDQKKLRSLRRLNRGRRGGKWGDVFRHMCIHLGSPSGTLGCGCGGNKKVTFFECNHEFGPQACCLHASDLAKIKSEQQLEQTEACESCSLRNTVPRFVTTAQYVQDMELLLAAVPQDVTTIVGVARSGLAAATMLAMRLHLPLEIVRQTQGDVVPAGNGWRLSEGQPASHRGVLVVDDTCMTGNSLKAVRPIVEQHFEERPVYMACVYVNPLSAVKPDLWVVDLPWPHLLEWNLFNSVLIPSCVMDFDGILCRDCPPGDDDDGKRYERFLRDAVPLYPVRKRSIPMVVTARLEKYRDLTTEWLQRWGISVDQLIMGPWESLAERNRSDVAAFKAKHFQKFMQRSQGISPQLFIESDPRQAARIAELSSGVVVCPAAGRCFHGRTSRSLA